MKFQNQLAKGENPTVIEVYEAIRVTDKWGSRIKRCNKMRYIEVARHAQVEEDSVSSDILDDDDDDEYPLPSKQQHFTNDDDDNMQGSHDEANATQGVRFSNNTNRKCYNCGQKGHMANRCPSVRRASLSTLSKSSKSLMPTSSTKRLPLNKDRRQPRHDQISYMSTVDLEIDMINDDITESAFHTSLLGINSIRVVIDSGATRHMSPIRSLFMSYKVFNIKRRFH